MKRASPFLALWGWPIALGVLSATGLGTALVSDTWGDWWSWVGLGVPVAVIAWFSWPRTPTTATAAPADTDARIAGTTGAPR
ncbi:hypothetical protein [Acidovorax sp. sic0104]|uniref:hypothetical protein n=1 Tax=Acidovorax sp. sic0104 TaxID=2854784 RepID=UPI001C494F97|nr:hypothetical protein [Acidovorax sp. sic0104]MBV7543374.1 hypothetical protein [Acidovorax sp. sic0104]